MNDFRRLLPLIFFMNYEIVSSLVKEFLVVRHSDNVLLPHFAYGFDTSFFFLLLNAVTILLIIIDLIELAHVLARSNTA